MNYALRWAAEHGQVLDESLSLRDEGLSAYHQRHIKSGALGAFLRAIDEGRIAPGSVLIVEGLDRLSRAEPIQAQAQLAQIVNAGITVVTASDGKEYNRERLKANPMDLVYSLLVMIRAHEESETKSKRVKAAVRRLCDGWVAGTYRGAIRNGKDPQWVTWSGSAWELVPERVEAVRMAIDLFQRGYGHMKIAEILRENGLQLTGETTNSQQIYRTARNRALIGEKTLAVDGEEYCLSGYYPSVLSADEWASLQQTVAGRQKTRGRKGVIPGLITGIGVARCGYCGGAMTGQTLTGRNLRPDGRPQDGHRRIICGTWSSGGVCPVGSSCSVVPVENALMSYCADQMNLSALLEGGDRELPIRARLTKARQEIEVLNQKLQRVTDALLSAADDGATPLTFVRAARDLETALDKAKADEEGAQRELMMIGQRVTPALAKAWRALVDGVETLDYDARLQARQMVRDTFERIVIYHRGMRPDDSDGKTIDLLLIAKSGGTRILTIDRKTGAWRGAEDLSG